MSDKDVTGGSILPDGIEALPDVPNEPDDRSFWQRINATEPLALRGAVGALVVLAIAFGAPIDPAQQKAILGFASAAIMLVMMWSGRSVVWPEDSVADVASESYVAGINDAEANMARGADIGGPI